MNKIISVLLMSMVLGTVEPVTSVVQNPVVYMEEQMVDSGITEEELKVFYRIVEAEVTGTGKFEPKKNVASCIMNRVGTFADTITDVVFQKIGKSYQFSPIVDGRYYTVTVTDETKLAVLSVLLNGSTHDCLYFCSMDCTSKWFKNKGTPDFTDGVHRFYRK